MLAMRPHHSATLREPLLLLTLFLLPGCYRHKSPAPPTADPFAVHQPRQQTPWFRPPGATLQLPPWTPRPARGQVAAAIAQSHLGKPYCWGGTGPTCYDCSGLTSTSWRQAGQAIPRTSTGQHDRLPMVAMSALQPGDIVWRPGHVGMYVGNGWAIHAPGRGKPIQYQAAHRFRSAHRPR